jgi:hypothetical protein
MMKIRRLRLLAFILSLMGLLSIIPSVTALPTYQELPCVSPEGCSEPVNPEEGEYYSIQCTINAIWVWRTLPYPMLVTGISLIDANALSDGGSLVLPLPNEVTVMRTGNIITISGNNGNLAPQPGEKSFSLSECIERIGGLQELPNIPPGPAEGQAQCMNLPTPEERERCLINLSGDQASPTATLFPIPTSPPYDQPTCENPIYASEHEAECNPDRISELRSNLPAFCDTMAKISRLGWGDFYKCMKSNGFTFIELLLIWLFVMGLRCIFGSVPIALLMLPGVYWRLRHKRKSSGQ